MLKRLGWKCNTSENTAARTYRLLLVLEYYLWAHNCYPLIVVM